MKRVPFVARGSGTSLSGGSVPVDGGIVIALNRLNRDPAASTRTTRTAVVEPGVINLHVSAAAAPHGLALRARSLQPVGLHASAATWRSTPGGAHCLKHGMTSNHVLGIRSCCPTASWSSSVATRRARRS